MSGLSDRSVKKTGQWPWVVTELKDPDLTAIALFCAIGLLATINVILLFPDLGAIIAQYNRF